MYDVIVVGAGLSGLQAALTCYQGGASVKVLEGRDRVGGKVLSAKLESGGCVELGAAWINDTNQRRAYAYARKFGLEMLQQNVDGKCAMHDSDGSVKEFQYGQSPPFPADDVKNLEQIRDLINDFSVKSNAGSFDGKELDDLTLDEFVAKNGGSPRTHKMVNLWTQVMIGVDSTEISAGFFIDYCGRGGSLMRMRSDEADGGQYLRFRTGAQQLAFGIEKLLPKGTVQLSSAVTQVIDHGTHVNVITHNGSQYQGRKLILSVPSPLYKDINFTPSLPYPKVVASLGNKLGYYTKVIAIYKKPWWHEIGSNGLSLSYEGPVVVARETSSPVDGQYSLTCFVNGSIGRRWSQLPADKRRSTVLQQIKKLYGNKGEALHPTQVLEMEWTKEQFSKGAVCPIAAPGIMTETGDVQRLPTGNVHFVGTEYSQEWKGYMEGALCSGEEGGEEVLQSLAGAGKFQTKL